MPELSTVPYALVVDDDAVILADAAHILQDAGFRTLTAMNAAEALQLMERHDGAVTVLFSDVEMPGAQSGFDLARIVAQRWPEVAIMIASGRAQCGEGDLPPGATFIRKPFSADVVHGRLADMLPDGRKPEPLRSAR